MFASFRFTALPELTAHIAALASNHSIAAWSSPVDGLLMWEWVGPAEKVRAVIAQELAVLAKAGPEQRVFTVLESPVAVAVVGPTGVQNELPLPTVVGPELAGRPYGPTERGLDAQDVEALLQAITYAKSYVDDDNIEVDMAVQIRWGQLAARLVRPGARIFTFVPKQVPAIHVESRTGAETL